MPYKDINNRLIAPAENPYVGSGSASSVASQDYSFAIVPTKAIVDLLEDVRRSIKLKRSIRLFFVGDYGYGKTTQLNLVGQEVRNANGVYLALRFQEIVSLIGSSSEPGEDLLKLQGAILQKMYRLLVKEGLLTQEDASLFERMEYIDLHDCFFEMLNKAQKANILLVFDELEILFSKLRIDISDFMGFLHSLSEKLSIRPGWGICVSITQREYYSQIIAEARQLQEGRFDFRIIQPLSRLDIKEYIEAKNSSVTLRVTEKAYPFENEVIDFVAVVSGGIPRYIETVCELLWSEAESDQTLVDLETARRIFTNKYQVYASAYFSELCDTFGLSDEAKAFLNLLYFSGGSRKCISDILLMKNSTTISYFHGLSDKQTESRLQKAAVELRNKLELKQSLEVFGQRPYRYTLTNLVFKEVFGFRERI